MKGIPLPAGVQCCRQQSILQCRIQLYRDKASVALTARFEPKQTEVGTGFTDVKSTDWYAEAVAYVVDNGLFTGTSDTTFTLAAP